MPPKSRISRQMIVDGGISVLRRVGILHLNVRAVAAELKCSTQPVMYHFATMEELKDEIYRQVDEYHTKYIMDVDFEHSSNPCIDISNNYIRFAVQEPHLFRFLFQTDRFANANLMDLVQSDSLAPVFESMAQMVQLTTEQAKTVFSATFLAVHGMASLLANNSMDYNEEFCSTIMENIFCGSIGMQKMGWEAMLYPNGEGRPDLPPPWEREDG